MSEFASLVAGLCPSGVSADFVEAQAPWIERHARSIGLTARFVISRTLLHLPFYTEEEISRNSSRVVKDIEPKVTHLGADYRQTYEVLWARSSMGLVTPDAKLKGRKALLIQDGVVRMPAFFKDVPKVITQAVQNNLHYIGSSRDDSVLDCGLYLDKAEVPYACTSFSICRRGYQAAALNRATGLNLKPNEVLSMTRAFAFDGAPTNSMSKLFHLAHEQVKLQFPECRAIVTALNPYLRFGGGIFTGSSYTPYALSPMEYWYDGNGYYVPRSKGQYPQQMETPSIIWLTHGLDVNTANAIEKLSIASLIRIPKEEYRNN